LISGEPWAATGCGSRFGGYEIARSASSIYIFLNDTRGWVMMKRLVATLAGGCMLLAGVAAHAAEKVMYQETTDNKPEVGVNTTVYLGDRMLEQRRGQWQECIVPKFSDQKTTPIMAVAVLVVKAGEPLCKSDPKSKGGYYPKTYKNWITLRYGDMVNPVKLKDKSGNYSLCMSSICIAPRNKDQFESGPYFIYSSNSFQQTIEYAGRNGENLKFTYSEFTDGYARQAFTREFQVDLTQGKVAAYKGAIIEIESATNSSITYKVVRNFQQ